MIQKSYEDSEYGKLYLIPTPIGNLDDITHRAINTLKTVDIVYAEDTRETRKLLSNFGIQKKIISCHKYTEKKNEEEFINLLKSGKNIGYVSDRGTPLISDPGSVITKSTINECITVIALPGASALLPAINMSGLDNDRFYFYGFLDSKKSARLKALKELYNFKNTIIFYEAPHRFKETINDMYEVFGNRNVSICREISKLHEEVFRGTLKEVIESYNLIKGEIVIVVEGNNNSSEEVDYLEKVKELVNKGYKMSTAVKEISIIYGISKNELYNKCRELL